MDLAVKGGNNGQKHFDDLKLDLVVSFSDTRADGLHNGIDQLPGEPPVVGGRLLVLRIDAVVLTVPIQKLIGDELLDNVEDGLHELCYFGIQSHFEYVEVLIGIIRPFFFLVHLLYSPTLDKRSYLWLHCRFP